MKDASIFSQKLAELCDPLSPKGIKRQIHDLNILIF